MTALFTLDAILPLILIALAISAWYLPRHVFLPLAGIFALWAFIDGRVDWRGVLTLAFMLVLIHLYYKREMPAALRAGLWGLIFVCMVLIYHHWAPGFNNFLIVDNVRLAEDSLPYRLYVNIDKVLAGCFLITFYARQFTLQVPALFQSVMKVLPLVVVALIGTSFTLGYIRFDPKFTSLVWLWVPVNLYCVCAVEEVLFRGFVQKELTKALSAWPYGKWVSLMLASLLFGFYHYPTGGASYAVLSSIAGISYGYAYLSSGDLRAAIATHFLVNLIHFMFFSYPALAIRL